MLNTIIEINLLTASEIFNQQPIWFDLEIDPLNKKFLIGGLLGIIEGKYYSTQFQEADLKTVVNILDKAKYVGGHNILQFDLPWLAAFTGAYATLNYIKKHKTIDTLVLSSLIFPHRPSHALLKIYKVKSQNNQPCDDALESYQLYLDIEKAWKTQTHPQIVKWIQQKQQYWDYLAQPDLSEHYLAYEELTPYGNIDALMDYINDIASNEQASWIGAIAFAHWLLHLDEPSCRRPTWLMDTSEYGIGFIEAEKLFWGSKQFQHIDFNLESQDIFNHTLRPGQEKIIHTLAKGESVPVGLLPTGGGKSLTFQLPAFILSRYRRELTIVISPLKALMEDQVLGLQQLEPWGSRTACLISGQDAKEQKRILEEVWQGGIDLLYVSPERLRTHSIQALLQRRRPALWVVDEAHTFSQWGTDFRPDFMRIGQSIAKCYLGAEDGVRPQLMLVTATASQRAIQEIEKEIVKPLHALLQAPLETVMMEPTQNVWRDEIKIDIRELARDDRLIEIVKILKQVFPQRKAGEVIDIEELGSSHPVVLIYVRNRDKTEKFAEDLAEQGFLTAAYHSRLTPIQKKDVLEKFKQHRLDVVICTNAFGMGIDRASIHTVIHYSPPNNLESYLQEIGRAARKQNEQGQAILFWSKQDLDSLVRKNIASELGGHKVLADCWQQVILPTLKRPAEERWFSSQELQPYLSFDNDELVTQIRVLLLALERHRLLVEKDQLPALLGVQLLDAPKSHSTRAAELYQRLAPLLLNQQKQVQLYLPEVSVALGMSVRQLLNGVRQLVKLGCARWSCEVRIRFAYSYSYIQRKKIGHKYKALDAIQECWDAYPPEDITQIDLRQLDIWFSQRGHTIKARDVFYIFKVFKLINLKENKYNLKVESRNTTHTWQDWLKSARQILNELERSFNLLQNSLPEDIKRSHQLNLDEFLEQYDLGVEVFLEHLEMMQCFAWLNVSRLDDETQKIFFIDLPEGQKSAGRLYSNVAYRYLEEHYQDRNRRLHLMNAWLHQPATQRKAMLNDYFNLDLNIVCQRYLSDPDQAKQAHLVNYETLIFPDFLNNTQRDIIADDERRAMLVLAGPGSGKTTIIVHRVANLVMLRNIDPEKILILAYNRQAVFEIRQRLTQLIGIDYAFSIHIFTFHGLARNLTNIHENQAPNNVDPNYKYQWLLEKTVEYLKDTPQYFQYILVDEFQDIDDVQYQLISHLAGMQRAEDDQTEISQQGFLVAVGDDDQNLYGFRGASIKYIQDFKKDYEIPEANVFYLLDNYRSPKDVIDLANQYIQQSLPAGERLKGLEHAIRSNNESTGNICFGQYQQQHGLDAIQWLVDDLKLKFAQQQEKLSDRPAQWSNFAILARQWSELLVVQHALTEAGILFQLLNKNDNLDLADSFLAKHLFAELELRPALEIIEGDAVIYLEHWLHERQWNRQDLSWSILKQRVSGYKDLSCQQMLDILRAAPEKNRTDRVILSTYHSAKGCEYEHVYIYDQWKAQVKEDPESQIRAMYVALTRAKQSLTIIQPIDQRWQHNYDLHIARLVQHLIPLQFKPAPVIDEISYFEQFSLADIYLSYRDIVQEDGRRRIIDIAQNQQFDVRHQVHIQPKYKKDKSFERLEIISSDGVVGAFSNITSQRLYRMNQQVSEVTCVGMQIIDYYQADKNFYERANYHGREQSHYVLIPALKIRRRL